MASAILLLRYSQPSMPAKYEPPVSPPGVHEVYLQPGEYFWGDENYRLKTLLGSCVALCVWHPHLKIGGMSHCLLPTRRQGYSGVRYDAAAPEMHTELSGRYVDETFEIFFHEMARSGTARREYQLKVFGGGDMFELADKSTVTVGERNLQMMREIVGRESIAVTAQHVGGKGHRNVIFELWSGDCWVRHGTRA